jgi:hypothetical protein
MLEVDDGIVKGRMRRTGIWCQNCQEDAYGIVVTELNLPEGISLVSKLIVGRDKYGKTVPITMLGISCGCYAKAHRQIAHIQDAQRSRSAST